MRQASNYLEGRWDIRCRTLVVALATALAISGCTLRGAAARALRGPIQDAAHDHKGLLLQGGREFAFFAGLNLLHRLQALLVELRGGLHDVRDEFVHLA